MRLIFEVSTLVAINAVHILMHGPLEEFGRHVNDLTRGVGQFVIVMAIEAILAVLGQNRSGK